jgi:prolipoprotein diacylglyceryl transferase
VIVGGTMTRLLGSLPSPSDGVFDIGPFPLRMYGVMIALGIIAAFRLGEKEMVRQGGQPRDFASPATWGIVAGLIGSRLYHVATSWENFSSNLGDIVKVWEGGLGVPGGLLAGITVGLWRAGRLGVSAPIVATAAAPTIPLGQAIGRWGNWWNQEVFGRPTDLPWGLEIDPQNRPQRFAAEDTFHPTFLYESLYNVALCAVLLWLNRHGRLKPGRVMAFYVAAYAFGRFFIEGLRIDPAKSGGGLRLNQWTAIVAFTLAVAYLAIRGVRHQSADVAPEQMTTEPADTPGDAAADETDHAT